MEVLEKETSKGGAVKDKSRETAPTKGHTRASGNVSNKGTEAECGLGVEAQGRGASEARKQGRFRFSGL